ncbi:MAG: ABC transporter permease [Treponema sp.]|jgi:putative ABC transport system permease protein|nr:ABC transporter permease [Treponema sp.]
MIKRKLDTATLSLANLKAKPVRTTCLALVAAVLAFALFGGSIIALNLRQGLNVMTKRFGADLMVVPQGAAEKAQDTILNGKTGYYYFDASIINTIECIDGVACASPQFFLTSLLTDCCDAAVQLIAYDPKTDFVVQPWITEKHNETVADGQVVAGSRITLRPNGTIKLYNREYPVAAQLSPSASGFDTSIFMTMNTMRLLIDTAHAEKYGFIADNYGDNIISAVLIQASSSKKPSLIEADLRRRVEGIDVLVSQGIFSGIAQSISGFENYIRGFSVIIWAMAIIVLAAVFSGNIHERKKEFALLRILGATRKKLVAIVLSESAVAVFAGSIAGIVLASLTVFPFSTYIGERLALPYLDIPFLSIVLLAIVTIAISVLAGPLSSLYSALKISRAETYFTMREGE